MVEAAEVVVIIIVIVILILTEHLYSATQNILLVLGTEWNLRRRP